MNKKDIPESVASFLDSLRQKGSEVGGEPAALPMDFDADIRQVDHDEDLVARFTREATAAGWDVSDARNGDLTATVASILSAENAKTVLLDSRMKDALTLDGVEITTAMDDDTLFSVDVAVTGVSAAIAETGSVVWQSSSQDARVTTLSPPMHIAVVKENQILADLCDFFATFDDPATVPSNINLITGPSKTADIEGTLVRGVHGPGRVFIVLC